jgi:quinoprotein glucose dehydrogenase
VLNGTAAGGNIVRHLQSVVAVGLLAGLVGAGVAVVRSQERASREWRYYGGDHAFTRYAPLDQITRDNVKSLKIAWRRPAVSSTLTDGFPDLKVNPYLKSTPIIMDGVIYTQNAHGLVTAFDGATGTTIWEQEMPKDEAAGDPTRGLDTWRAGSDRRILAIRGEHLYALNAATGKTYPDFGDRGRVNLHFADPQPLAGKFTDTSGAIVVGNVVVVAGYTNGAGDSGNKKERARDDIRGFDVRSGALLWTFHVVPQQGEPGVDSWGNDSWKYAGDLGAWNPLSADDELGYVYVPLTAPTSAAYGGWRPGDNLYSNSLVALDAKTGKRAWHYQMIHHDLWEFDNVGPPTLGEISANGRRIKVVVQPNKNGFLFVLDRTNGKPVWPIEERPVPSSTVPGEHTAPTQPFPTKPPAFDRQGFTDGDLIDFTPELREQAREVARQYVMGPLYTPPTVSSPNGTKGTMMAPGAWGAANWHTGAFDPDSGMYYAVSLTLPAAIAVTSTAGNAEATMEYQWGSGGGPRPQTPPAPDFVRGLGPQIRGLPIWKPPYGRITAFNLNTGDQVWMSANGDGPRNHPLLKDLHLPPLGVPNRPAPLLTKTLLFIGEGSDAIIGTPQVDWGWGTKFRAYDKLTGKVVWETDLPSGTTGGPMTYMAKGRQFIIVPVGAKDHPPEFVALALEDVKTTNSGPR